MNKPIPQQNIVNYLASHSPARTFELQEAGLSKYHLNTLIKKGDVIRLERGLYQLAEQELSQWQSYLEVQKQAPKGVICLLSALTFHEMSTQNPHEVWVTLPRDTWKPTINYPPVRYFTVSEKAYMAGIGHHEINGITLQIYSPAKTVADCFKYRNKIGIDIAIEALKEGWRKKLFTIEELIAMAKVCRVETLMRPYIEAILHN